MRSLRTLALLLVATLVGCAREKPGNATLLSTHPTVQLVKPQKRTIAYTFRQPGVIEAYEQTSVYTRISGYVLKWYVDIGAKVKKDELLAELSVPDLVEEHRQKVAQVDVDKAMVAQAQKLVAVALGNLQAAGSEINEAKASVARYQADVERWESEVKRLTKLVEQRVVDKQVLDETQRQLKSSQAARAGAMSAVQTKEAQRLAAEALTEKAQADTLVAQAKVTVSEAGAGRLAALVSYTKITAPYDGMVILRNINTGDFVRPASGDPSAAPGTPDQSAGRATPLFVVARMDPVRFVVGVPEMDAHYVTKGIKARIRLQSLQGEELTATVSRTSWSLHTLSRTMRAEIDLLNPAGAFLPGMYGYGYVTVERAGALALPRSALTEVGNHMVCFLYQDGLAIATPVQTGLGDAAWIEVCKKAVKSRLASQESWESFTGAEQVIVGDLTELNDGQRVVVAPSE